MVIASYYAITGMTCTACSGSITEAVQQIDGVESIEVSLITEEAKVIHQDNVSTKQIISSIEDCGFDAVLKKQNQVVDSDASSSSSKSKVNSKFRILGMTCGSCSASIKEALMAIPGVESASISDITEEGLICHTCNVTTDLIKATIEDCGFDASLIDSTNVVDSDLVTKFAIGGMTCSSCSGTIIETLEKIDGVLNVNISLVTEEGEVQHTTKVDSDTLRNAIEDCGFDARILNSSPVASNLSNAADEIDSISFQIVGINEMTDVLQLQYNIEARLNSFNGISDFRIAFKNGGISESIVTDSNSEHIQAIRSEYDDNEQEENFIDELIISYNPQYVGIRHIVDELNHIDNNIQFIPVNSVDQSASSQLKLLSRVKEIQYWRSISIKTFIFGCPVIFLSYAQDWDFWRHFTIIKGLYVVSMIQCILTAYVQFHLGASFFKKFKAFFRNRGRNATMDVLVCISTSISFAFSILSIFLSVWNGKENKAPKVLFETSCMLIFFIAIGKWLENTAKGSTTSALSKLISLAPTKCTIVEDLDEYNNTLQNMDKETDILSNLSTRNIGIDLVQTGDVAVVLAGAKIPADGVICLGNSEVDESFITGESLPIYKQIGDSVIGGSVNGNGLIHVKVSRTGKNSQLQKIINLVKDSQIKKAPVQRFADFIAARFVPSVLLLSLFTFLVWTALCSFLPNHLPKIFNKEENGKIFVCLQLGISVIVVACPCALGLAAPTAVMVGTGVGATQGVLIKGGEVLENVSKVNIIMFDKTGTLTTGEMSVAEYKNTNESIVLDDWLNLIGSIEANSEHPVGKAITTLCRSKLGLNFEEDSFTTTIKEFEVMSGMGIKATVLLPNHEKSHNVFVGNERMISTKFEHLIKEKEKQFASNMTDDTVAHVIIDSKYSGYILCTDKAKPGARQVIDYLKYSQMYKVGMITGDNRRAAVKIGQELGIPECNIFSEISPVDKDRVIVDIKNRFGHENVGIAFIGDGINDAPALVQADVGMAVSSGSDIAIESADVVLMGAKNGQCDLYGVAVALSISNATFKRIKMNFLWAIIYNMFMLPFAMGCFLWFNIMLPPVAAAACMAMSSVSVVISSLFLKKWKAPSINEYDVKVDEADIGVEFSLRDSSIEEFNRTKRGQAFYNRFRRSSNNQYELLPTQA